MSQGVVGVGTAINAHRGRLEAAERHIHRFAELQSSADVQEQAEYGFGRSALSLAQGDAAEALRIAEQALEMPWLERLDRSRGSVRALVDTASS
ncbi:MAG TPA: hypothetical protein VEQ37_04895 [Actinomycetota bacterium]|nr:hypothetical protein [Actinomycetota bacterium]